MRPPIHGIEQSLLDFIRAVYDAIGWPGVVVMMAIESAAIPLPSELIMPAAGWFLVKDRGLGWEWIILAGLFGALGNTLGSWLAYEVAARGGRPLLERYGRYLLISRHDLDRADAWFRRYGPVATFFSRVLPVVRTFISLPAGIARMNRGIFLALTFLGSFPWSVALAAGGYKLGENYERLRNWMRPADIPILVVLVVLIAWLGYRHVRRALAPAADEPDQPDRETPLAGVSTLERHGRPPGPPPA